ncbi:MAG: DEAD/DEAH box helicase family protein [Thermoplasmatales archaeon]
MGKINFKPVPGCVGEYSEHGNILKLIVPIPYRSEVRKRLTIINKGSFFRMNQIMKNSIPFINRRLENCEDGVEKVQLEEMLGKLWSEYKVLQDNQKKKYFEETPVGDFLVPPGLWYLAEKIKDDRHINAEVKDIWTPDYARDYQKEDVAKLLKYKRGTGVWATGLGKSILALSICKTMEMAGKRICVVVPTEELVKQMSQTIGTFCDTTTAGGGRHPRPGANVLVTTAASAIKYIDIYDCIIIDESHHSSAKTWENLLLAAQKADYIYNLTATPFRTDGMDLGIHAFGGPIVFERDVAWGVRNGWLSKLKVYMVFIDAKDRNNDPIDMPTSKKVQVVYKILSSMKEVNNFLLKNLCAVLERHKKAMVLYKTVKAGESLSKILSRAEIPHGLASSSTKKIIKDFRENKIKIMISNDRLVGEGVDIPDADLMINLLQNSSEVITSQVTGRILRPSPGKECGVMIDVCFNGYPQFENSAIGRLRLYQKITDDITIIGKPRGRSRD